MGFSPLFSFFKIFFVCGSFLLIYFWLCWVFIAFVQAFSSFDEWGQFTSYGSWAPHCGCISSNRARALGSLGFSSCNMHSVIVGRRLSWSMARGIFLSRDQTSVPCIGRWISYPLHHQGRPMQTIFKDLIEFVTALFLFYVLAFWLRGMWDLNSPARDQTPIPCIGRWSLNHWITRESHPLMLLLAFPWYRGRDIRLPVRFGVENPVLLPGRWHIISVNLLNSVLFLKIKRFHIKKFLNFWFSWKFQRTGIKTNTSRFLNGE